jgi:calcineurin-like phosphoesterase
VIGVRREQSIAVMRSHMPQRYDAADEDPWLNAVLIRATGLRAESIESVLRPVAPPG